MSMNTTISWLASVAPLAGSVDRNESLFGGVTLSQLSLPSRGAWIEMAVTLMYRRLMRVAPLAGSVDRNRYRTTGKLLLGGRSPRGERG